jgi:radical SAM superfamily enzyme YgiQ (UPF0313 family)
MDALFVRVPNLKDNEYLDLWGAVTPDSILGLASYLESQGARCNLVDFYADSTFTATFDPEAIDERVSEMAELLCMELNLERPLVIGFTTLSNGEAWVARAVAERVKARFPGIPILMGGYFATNNCREVLQTCAFIDGIVVGEGEHTTLEIIRRLRDKQDPFHSAMTNVCYRDNGHIVAGPRADVFELKKTPCLNYGLLRDPSAYQTLAYHTSRGCPWRCNYCLEVTMGTRYRTKPNEVVAQDIKNFKALNEEFFLLLTDPMLAVSDKRLQELCALFESLKVTFLFETRVDVLSPALIPAVRQAGCNSIYFGFESASFDTLIRMNKLRPPDYAQYLKYLQNAEEIVKSCARYHVTPLFGVMVGYPGDTPEDLMCSLDFIRKLRSIYLEHVPERQTGAGFVVSPSEVYIPRSSATWDAQAFFSKKGLRVLGEDLFGDYKVDSASKYLDHREIMTVFHALRSLSINPPETRQHSSAPKKQGNMAATMAAKVTH